MTGASPRIGPTTRSTKPGSTGAALGFPTRAFMEFQSPFPPFPPFPEGGLLFLHTL